MPANNAFLFGLSSSTEVFRKILYFPLWWFTGGLLWYFRKCFGFFRGWVEVSGFLVWLKNVFKPMYGQSDWAGLMIGFVIRLVQIFFRGIFLSFWLIITLVFFSLWFLIPLFAAYQLLFQIFPETKLYVDALLGLFLI